VCPPAPAQHAALGAFDPESIAEVDGHVAVYERNRDVLLAGLRRMGITRVAPPDGAFYVYADVSHLTGSRTSMDLVYEILADTGVAIAPGRDFDPVEGDRWVRFSVAGSTDDVHEALDRLGRWLPGHVPT
jgi:aspartate/methionine/tyrosine aminotransferase